MNNLPPDPNQPTFPPNDPNISGYVFKGSEGGVFPEDASKSEAPSPPEAKPSSETLGSQEKVPIPTPEIIQPESRLEIPKDGNVEPTQIQNVVDKTNQVTSLHEVKTPKDKLTKEADDEEEHFIEEVEKHHGNL